MTSILHYSISNTLIIFKDAAFVICINNWSIRLLWSKALHTWKWIALFLTLVWLTMITHDRWPRPSTREYESLDFNCLLSLTAFRLWFLWKGIVFKNVGFLSTTLPWFILIDVLDLIPLYAANLLVSGFKLLHDWVGACWFLGSFN